MPATDALTVLADEVASVCDDAAAAGPAADPRRSQLARFDQVVPICAEHRVLTAPATEKIAAATAGRGGRGR